MTTRSSSCRTIRYVVAGVGAASTAALLFALPAGASTQVVPVVYTTVAHAPVMQVTEDEPTASFHPEGEGDYGYTIVTADPSAQSAMAANVWPGSAAGNAGTLAEVLGAPSSAGALNDPARASAGTGTTTSQTVSAPSGTTMTASIQPTGANDQHTTATSSSAGGALGSQGTIGSSTSTSTIDFRSDSGLLTVLADSTASHINIAGVVKIGSVTSTASGVADDGTKPKLGGTTDVHDMSIAGQPAYVDGSGVHMGKPGKPAGPAEMEAVDAALAASGMKIYSSTPATIDVGGTSYYTAASIIFYWLPPGSHNTFTMSLGGAGVAVSDGQNPSFQFTPPPFTPATTGSTVPSTPPVSTAAGAPSSSTPTGGSPAPSPTVAGTPLPSSGGVKLDLPAPPSPVAVPASVRLPGGIGIGWIILAAALGLAGAATTTRVPGLLTRQAAATCPRAARPRSSFGK
jgi:hypothetical protein